ncbi:choice-of-anchor C family protein [candidate division KSB1 bacterium]|nr:choice-of-anchor C family protein [candidate division KSB1 bacterium]
MKKLGLIVAIFCIGAFVTNVFATNLILNGSFEQSIYSETPGYSFKTLTAGTGNATAINNWTVNSGSIDYIYNYWQASDGKYSLDMSGAVAGGIQLSQSINTVLGKQYLVSFDMAGNPDNKATGVIKTLEVAVAGISNTFTFDVTSTDKSNMGWQTNSFIFTASGTSTILNFKSLTNTPYGPALDNVSVTQVVPEPGTCLLLGVGLVGIGAIQIKRRKQK